MVWFVEVDFPDDGGGCHWNMLECIFIVAPCILKIHRVLHTNECTNYILYISLKFIAWKELKILLHVSILRSSSGSTYCSLLKLRVKIVNMSLYISVMWQHIMICCHITDNYNDTFTVLTCNFSKEQYMLPEDDIRIETCRYILSALM